MKKINENTKVTLTLKQLKNLVKESAGRGNFADLSRLDLFIENYARVFLYIECDDTCSVFGANSPEEFFEATSEFGTWPMDYEEIWNLKLHGVREISGNDNYVWFRVK